MADQPKYESTYLILDEMVDTATNEPPVDPAEIAAALRQLTKLVVTDWTPRFLLEEVVERVAAAAGPEVEALLRKHLREIMASYRRHLPPRQGPAPSAE